MLKCYWLTLAVAVVTALTPKVSADDQAEAKAVIAKAIDAMGVKAREEYEEYNAMTFKEKGTYYGMGEAGVPYSGDYAVQFPDQFRMTIEGVFEVVLDRDKGWIKMGGEAQEMNETQLKETREQQYAAGVTMLTPVLKEGYRLSLVNDAKAASKPALGVTVSHEGHRDVKLYFDPETHLLLRAETKVRAEELGGREVVQITLFRDYKEVQDIKVPTEVEVIRDGKKFLEAEQYDLKFEKALDPDEFAKP